MNKKPNSKLDIINITEEKKEEYKRTWLFTLSVFLILLITMVVVGGTIYILYGLGIVHVEVANVGDWFSILIFILSSIIIGTIFSTLFGRVVLGSANKVNAGLRALASGKYDTRIYLGENKESQRLAASFNILAQELDNTKLLKANFVNEFAHEFKTPIVSIKGFAELLKKGDLTEEQQREYIDVIIEESERLAQLAVNSLNLSKVEKQEILTDVEEFNLSEQIRTAVLLLENKWQRKNLEFNLEIDEYYVLANEELLKQVWINLLDNAIKFSTDGGVINVDINKNDSGLTVNIGNYGKTLNSEEKARMFEKFYRGSNAYSIEGTGVGLAIVKKIVDLHHGKITVESENDYTCFSVKLNK